MGCFVLASVLSSTTWTSGLALELLSRHESGSLCSKCGCPHPSGEKAGRLFNASRCLASPHLGRLLTYRHSRGPR